uniref:ATP-dependent DNA helicase n=1 Tax=Parastrongyloides trichosuri TaxID=131310 RepID=A0A0N5A1I1_PARTI
MIFVPKRQLTYNDINGFLDDDKYKKMTNEEKACFMLKVVFKLKEFKSSKQKNAILNAMERKHDTYACLATGGGKSLCYQLPAITRKGVTIVFSPLLALIKDQMEGLTKLGIKCGSLISSSDKSLITSDLYSRNPTYQIIFTTPESSNNEKFLSLLRSLYMKGILKYFVVDEAHCISQWGHDFRHDYLLVGKIRNKYIGVPWIILTATAPKNVEDDIMKYLNCVDVKKFYGLLIRSNIYYDVVYEEYMGETGTINNHICNFVKNIDQEFKTIFNKSFPTYSGIIYVRTVKGCEKFSQYLKAAGINAEFFHGQMENNAKEEVYKRFINDKIQVVVATTAFGMGINKSNVRFVLHLGPPDDLASYYQESGRAGRDGRSCICRIYFSKNIKYRNEILIRSRISDVTANANTLLHMKEKRIDIMKNNFEQMIEYCESLKCRHASLLLHFGRILKNTCQSYCDYCKDPNSVNDQLSKYMSHFDNLRKGAFEKNNENDSTRKRKINELSNHDESIPSNKIKKICSTNNDESTVF